MLDVTDSNVLGERTPKITAINKKAAENQNTLEIFFINIHSFVGIEIVEAVTNHESVIQRRMMHNI